MIIDTHSGTVDFADETLCVHELKSLVSLLESGLVGHQEELAEWEKELLAKPVYPLIAYVQSYSRKGMFYQLKLEGPNKLWTCTCPDYTNRGYDDQGRQNGHECKHIRRHIYTM